MQTLGQSHFFLFKASREVWKGCFSNLETAFVQAATWCSVQIGV